MADHNLLACLWWADPCTPTRCRCFCTPVAFCDHDGCSWESTAKTEQTQIEAFINHHQFRHGDDR